MGKFTVFNSAFSIILIILSCIFTESQIIPYVLILYTLLMIGCYVYYIRTEKDQQEINPVISLLLIPVFIGSTMALYSCLLYTPKSLINISILLGIIITITAYWSHIKKNKRKVATVIIMIMVWSFVFSGAILYSNMIFDNSEKQVITTQITEKVIYSNRLPFFEDYYLYLKSWHNVNDPRMKVSKKFFKSVEEGNYVDVIVREGFFKIPYLQEEVSIHMKK